MTETSSDAPRGMSIEALRKRVTAVESRFSRIDDENKDYRRRLDDLMAAVEGDQRRQREEITVLEQKIESLASENIQLRVILDELLTAAEAFGEVRLDETLADLDARVRQEDASKDIFVDAAARIGEARAAAAAVPDGDTAAPARAEPTGVSDTDVSPPAELADAATPEKVVEDEAALTADPEPEDESPGARAADDASEPLTLEPVKETEPGLEPQTGSEAEAIDERRDAVEPDEIVLASELKDEALEAKEAEPEEQGSDADQAPDEEVLELKTEILDAEVETISRPEPAVEKPAKSETAQDDKKVVEITTDKETDQLDRILASIRRITSSL